MIDYVTSNYESIFAAIGALYVAARAVVVLTPTPRDDKVVEQVGGWLKKIADIFGLDFKQGRNNG